MLKESSRQFNLLPMQKVAHTIRSLSRARQIVLAGSLLALIATFAPWHTVGTVTFGTESSYSGFTDQNMIIGVIVFVFLAAALAITVLPAFGFRLPRTSWRESALLIFLGGESALLVFVLTVMHATSISRSANYDLRIGIHLALIGSVLVFFGGYLLKNEEQLNSHSRAEPLAHLPSRRSPHSIDLRDNPEKEKEDSRMKLDI